MKNTRGYPHVIRDQVSSMNGDILTTLGQGYGNGWWGKTAMF